MFETLHDQTRMATEPDQCLPKICSAEYTRELPGRFFVPALWQWFGSLVCLSAKAHQQDIDCAVGTHCIFRTVKSQSCISAVMSRLQ